VGTAENNKTVQRRIIDEVINQKKLDSADELFSEEHVLHPESTGVGRGPESIVAEGDMVAVRLTFRGTHAPTGEKATWPEMVFARFSESKAVESWQVTDTGRSWDSPPW
jgi:predicted ester cyclase